ncbi:RNA-binding ribosome biosynthesis protein mak21 [Cladophialophora chaetospira]|uniref:RNA-binding ribosome biosynthesis protein mak21 n=1 Tax=Cladophialophora chaetospira TaxID=386627 RepID=A0AA38XGG1_9EURO|nr:RNA-binding ribosome biosynthesis protein mak21 [Cladophialophora chaetospira]
MPKDKRAASGANAIKANKSRTKPSKHNPESKDVQQEDLRKTIQRRYLRESDLEKIEDKKNGGNKKLLKAKTPEPHKKSSEIERGKKRDRNGKILNQNKKDNDEQATTAQGTDADENVLEREMKELGGTAEDLDLLAGIDSESEVEGDTPKTAVETLDKGLKNILKEIALAQGEVEEDEQAAGEPEESEPDIVVGGPQKASTSKSAPGPQQEPTKRGKKSQTQYICDPKPEWYDVAEPDVDTETSPKYTISKDSIDQLHDYAKSLLDEENEKFKISQESSSAQSFYNTVITSGTLSDKISALTLAVQESPIHNVKALETLIALASKRSRSQAVDVLRALKDLFAQGSLLPPSRKLYAFASQPSLLYLFGEIRNWKTGQKLPRGLDSKYLVIWAFEHWLKEQYFEILKILEVWCNDEIEFSKARAVSYVYELLKERPEQESNLLRLLVNKLGDPVKKIASQASYLLMQLLISHPAMKMVVVSAVESDFIFRPGQSLHGKYYAVVTLNQTALSGKEEDVAIKLLDIYFGLFTGLLKEDKPATTQEEEGQEPQTRGERRRKKNKKPSMTPGQAQASELREKLISAILTGVNRAYPYTTSADTSNTAFSSHLDTLFKITHSANFNTSIQSLMLIQQISQASQHKASNDRFYRVLYESLLDPRLIIASKQQLYLNLLHRALKADLHVNRVKAFVKRLVQVLSLHEPNFICGACFLIQDLVKTFPGLKSLIDEAEDHDEDDVEVFRDAPDEDDGEHIHPTRQNQIVTSSEQTSSQGNTAYDAHKRDPLHANASHTSLWELLPFLAHFHPSVSLSADNLLLHRPLSGKPDLTVHTLAHFLDRFVYRNPKLSATGGLRGSSIMQSMATENTDAVLLSSDARAALGPAMNSENFRRKMVDEVSAEDVFFHTYFSSLKKTGVMSAKERKKAEKRRAERDIDGGDDDEEEEDKIWKAMMASAPELEGDEFDDDDDVNLEFDDLDSDGEVGSGDEMPDDEENDDADGDGEVDFDPAFFDDEEDLMALDAADAGVDADEIPGDVSDFAGFDSDAEAGKPAKKAKKDKEERKRLKNLPTFASVEDYAKMLDDDEDEDLGR